jgi:hypothetical protein
MRPRRPLPAGSLIVLAAALLGPARTCPGRMVPDGGPASLLWREGVACCKVTMGPMRESPSPRSPEPVLESTCAVVPPAGEAVVERLPRPVAFGHLAPLGAGVEPPEDAVEDDAVVAERPAAAPGAAARGQVRRDPLPVVIGQFVSPCHARPPCRGRSIIGVTGHDLVPWVGIMYVPAMLGRWNNRKDWSATCLTHLTMFTCSSPVTAIRQIAHRSAMTPRTTGSWTIANVARMARVQG